MDDRVKERIDDEALRFEISDEALEAAAFAEKIGAYTEFAWCTQFTCPG